MNPTAASRLVAAPYSETVVKETASALRRELGATPSFGIVFATPNYIPHVEDFLELIRLHAHVPVLVGCSSHGLIGQAEETEGQPGFSLLLFSLPNVEVKPFPIDASMIEEGNAPSYWREKTGLSPEKVKAWLMFADPFHYPVDIWMRKWNQAYAHVPTFGGLASGYPGEPEAWLFYNNKVIEGGLAVALCGDIEVSAVVSQGCRPIGEPLTVTQAEKNVLLTLGSKPAYEVLNDVFQSLTTEEKENARGHLFAGLAMNEYVDDFKRGDFLIRNIIGADPVTGAVVLNARPRVGQTLQYQLRDAATASEELNHLLEENREKNIEQQPFAALICTCNGRGRGMFKEPNHDAQALANYFPNLPVAGFFANGEIGPVGHENFIHGYTASLAFFSAPKA